MGWGARAIAGARFCHLGGAGMPRTRWQKADKNVRPTDFRPHAIALVIESPAGDRGCRALLRLYITPHERTAFAIAAHPGHASGAGTFYHQPRRRRHGHRRGISGPDHFSGRLLWD